MKSDGNYLLIISKRGNRRDKRVGIDNPELPIFNIASNLEANTGQLKVQAVIT